MRSTALRFLATVFALSLPLAAPAQEVVAVDGETISVSVGARDGVRVGLTGRVARTEMVGGALQTFDIATFEVVSVEAGSSRARLTAVGGGQTVAAGDGVVFDQELRPPRADRGVIVIRSNVSGDVAYLDGRRLGPTPQRVKVSPGAHAVRVEKDGFEPAEQRVTVAAGQTATARATLTGAPTDPGAVMARANTAFDAGRWMEAIAGYEALLRLVPNEPLASRRLGEARQRLQEERTVAEEARRRAAEDARRAREVREKLANAEYLLKQGDAMMRSGSWSLAAEYYGPIALIDPRYEHSGARLSLAVARAALEANELTHVSRGLSSSLRCRRSGAPARPSVHTDALPERVRRRRAGRALHRDRRVRGDR